MNNKIALFTDIHFGIHQNSKEWIQITFQWLQTFKKYCLDNNIKEIIFCGDFFNPRDVVTWSTIDYGKKCIDYLRKDFILHLLVGNHCCYLKDNTNINSLNIFKGLQNVNVYDQPSSVSINNKQFLFIPWFENKDKLQQVFNCFNYKFDVMIGHFEINSFKMSGKICENNVQSNELLNKASLIFTGHFHTRQTRKYNNGEIVYIGNPFQMDYSDENDDKGFAVLNTDNMTYTFINNTISPVFHRILYSEWKTIQNEEKRVKTIKNNFITIIINEKLTNEELEKILTNIRVYNPRQLTVNIETLNEIKNNKIEINTINMQESFNTFISTLDFNDKQKLIKYILDKYETSKL